MVLNRFQSHLRLLDEADDSVEALFHHKQS